MRLCTQRLGEALDPVEFAGQRLQFGVVPQGDNGANGGALHRHRAAADQQHPVVGEGDFIGQAVRIDDQLRDVIRQSKVTGSLAGGIVDQVEQSTCLRVDSDDPAVAVQQQHSFVHGGKDRVVIGEQAGQLARSEAERLPLHPSSDQQGADEADGEGAERNQPDQ